MRAIGTTRRPRPALVGEVNEAVERRLRSLETKPPVDVEAVERAIDRVRRPDLLAQRLGDPLRYSQRVESEVAALGIDTLLPYADGDHVGRFLAVWTPDELGHGALLERLLGALGLPTMEPRPADFVPWHNRVTGWLGRRSRTVYEMVSMAYHSIGAMNERLAFEAYGRMGHVAQELGETELADQLFHQLRRDESAHLGYYRTYARQLRVRLSAGQLAVVRTLIAAAYAPVGAGETRDKAPFGRTIIALEDDPDNPAVAAAAQEIARELLATPDGTIAPFVLRSMQGCVDRARAEVASPPSP